MKFRDEIYSPEDSDEQLSSAIYRILTAVISTANLDVSEHTRSVLKHLYLNSGCTDAVLSRQKIQNATLLSKVHEDSKKEIKFKESSCTQINNRHNKPIFNTKDLEIFLASELSAYKNFYIFENTPKEPNSNNMVLYISGFIGYINPEMGNLLQKEKTYIIYTLDDNYYIDIPIKGIIDARDFNIPGYDKMSDDEKCDTWYDMCRIALSPDNKKNPTTQFAIWDMDFQIAKYKNYGKYKNYILHIHSHNFLDAGGHQGTTDTATA